MGKIIDRVRQRECEVRSRQILQFRIDAIEQSREQRNQLSEACKKRYSEMLADPRYENVWMHPVTGAIIYCEKPETKPWWRLW